MDLIKQVNEALEDEQAEKDVNRLVDYYLELKFANSDHIRELAGDDLEMLEYSPEEIEKLVPKIVDMVAEKRKKNRK